MNRLTEHQRDAHLKMRVVPAAVRDTHYAHKKTINWISEKQKVQCFWGK